MLPSLLAALALTMQAEPSIRERILALANDPAAHREELLQLGPAAIRPLLELKRPELEPILFDLKFAASGEPGEKIKERLRTSSATFTAKDLPFSDAIRLAAGFCDLPVLIDPAIRGDGGPRHVTVDLQSASMKSILDLICGRTGLDYGWVRGLVVLSTPERLWSAPPEPIRKLADEELARLRGWIGQLSDDSVHVRADASRRIDGVGEAALPHLEEAAREGELERRLRLRDAIFKIRRRHEPACFDRPLTLERQELPAAGRAILASLRDHEVETIDLSEVPLSAAIPLVLAPCHVEGETSATIGSRKVACVFDGLRALDVLFFLTVPYGLDAGVKNGKLVIDTREQIDAALSER